MLLVTAIVLVIPVIFVSLQPLEVSSIHRYLNLPIYNDSYPLTPPLQTSFGTTYRIGAVADLDTNSHTGTNAWISYLKIGYLTVSADFRTVQVSWNDEIIIKSDLSQKGRGMELSELIVFNGKLYTCDDRSGIVFEITSNYEVLPYVILNDGDGQHAKGFKCEWMTVKDGVLWVGGLGKEWTTTVGVVQNLHPQWVKSIGLLGDVKHHNWVARYNALREKAGFLPPGYMIHESAAWSSVHQRWFFLPRRASRDIYTEVDDEYRGTNVLFSVNDNFSDISLQLVGPLQPTRGFSSFKFVPNSQDQLVIALKSEEVKGKIASYITAFTLQGEIVLNEVHVGDHKFEGIEFL